MYVISFDLREPPRFEQKQLSDGPIEFGRCRRFPSQRKGISVAKFYPGMYHSRSLFVERSTYILFIPRDGTKQTLVRSRFEGDRDDILRHDDRRSSGSEQIRPTKA
jgi:hypothetical protein